MKLRVATEEDVPGILECLEVLSDVSFTDFKNIEYSFRARENSGLIVTLVVVDSELPSINSDIPIMVMGTASLIITPKLSHDGKSSALVDDVAVRQDCQGLGIGKWLVESCIDYAKNADCYKVILNCSADNVEFYEKSGFKCGGQVEMRLDL